MERLKRRPSTDLFDDEPVSSHSTPVRAPISNRSEDEESPYFPCSTQEMREDVDVLWDYNSPRSKAKSRKPKKLINVVQSPKVPLRRHPSANNEQIKQDFCKLREELRALKAEIAKPDHEESLVLSPREEEAFKITQEPVVEEQFDLALEEEFEDPFDDDMDDKLILFSQQIEGCDTDFNQLTQVVDIRKYKTDANKYNNSNKNSKVILRSQSENKVQTKVEWHRTKSFENYTSSQLSKSSTEEIERKRQQAKAKLEAKMKPPAPIPEHSDSPLKCSPEEIEKKRLQALAKLEAKRQQEMIEKKKQEAFKRREENRRIKGAQVKSSLSTKL